MKFYTWFAFCTNLNNSCCSKGDYAVLFAFATDGKQSFRQYWNLAIDYSLKERCCFYKLFPLFLSVNISFELCVAVINTAGKTYTSFICTWKVGWGLRVPCLYFHLSLPLLKQSEFERATNKKYLRVVFDVYLKRKRVLEKTLGAGKR